MAKKLRTITLGELDKFQIDDATGKLYWGESAVRTEVKLPDWAVAAAWVAAAATAIQALGVVTEHGAKWWAIVVRLLG
jgi:hypothetical protein